eukprot:TRINITY_DN19356_c0_g1_i2.p1 TRINITY_DN19356_c0_g1~~TRINITY_DN19356_c0_g1_i2.p1  ORF type:complete len:1159 (+),score=199.59 TRINITY_DN19356_c0_g1_i2:187-3663(+)
MPSAQEWSDAQREVWALKAEVASLTLEADASIERLSALKLQEAELRFTLRMLRRCAAEALSGASPISAPWPPDATRAVRLEEALGSGMASSWEIFLKAIAARPQCLSVVAKAAGRKGCQVLAYFAAAMAEDYLAVDSCTESAGVLDQILAAEIEQALASASASKPALLSDGSFLAAFLHTLTADEPACELWMRDALADRALGSISQVLRNASSSNIYSSRPSSRFSISRQPSRRDTCLQLEAFDQKPAISLVTFLGETGADLPGPVTSNVFKMDANGADSNSIPGRSNESNHVQETFSPHEADAMRRSAALAAAAATATAETTPISATQGSVAFAATATVDALCSAAGAAPPRLYRLAAAMSRSFAKCSHEATNDIADADAQTCELLAGLLLSRWLVPALLTPNLGLGLGLTALCRPASSDSFSYQAAPVLVSLAKLLKAVASSPGAATALAAAADSARAINTVASTEGMKAEALQFRALLLNVLVRRGRSACVPPTRQAGQQLFPLSLSCCAVVSLQDLQDLGRSISEEGNAETVAEAVQVRPELVKMLGSCSARHISLERPVVCWFSHGQCQAQEQHLEHSSPQSPRNETAALSILRQLLAEPRNLCGPAHDDSLETCNGVSSVAVDADRGELTCKHASCDSNGFVSNGYGHNGHDNTIADSASSALAAALRSGRRRGAAWGREEGLSYQLKLELLEELMHDLQREDPDSNSSSSSHTGGAEMQGLEGMSSVAAVEKRLLDAWHTSFKQDRRALEGQRSHVSRIRVAESVVKERCKQVSDALAQCSQAAWSSRWSLCLQALWTANKHCSPSSASCPHWPELCIVGPRIHANARIHRRQATPHVKVQILERALCPSHRMADVAASMGVDGRSCETDLQHFPISNLKYAIAALRELPLETAVQGDDLHCVASALQDLVSVTVQSIAQHCEMQSIHEDPQGFQPSRLLQGEERHLNETVVRFLFEKLHGRLFPCQPTEEDLKIASQISKFAWLRPRHLGVKQKLADSPQAFKAADLLRKLHNMRNPVDMLDILARVFRVVTQAACLRSTLMPIQTDVADPLQGSDTSKSGARAQKEAFGADEATPLFILVVLRANPPMLESVLMYAERFTGRAQRLTEQGYSLTQLRVAVSFIADIQSNKLNLQPGEWENHVGNIAACV